MDSFPCKQGKSSAAKQSKPLVYHESNEKTVVRLTCEGNLGEPDFKQKLKKIVNKIKFLLSNANKSLEVIKVEPWNSVRVTFNLPDNAAQQLRQLAERRDENLQQLGILTVQLEGQQVISLRIPNTSNTQTGQVVNNNNNNVAGASSRSKKVSTNTPADSELANSSYRQINGTETSADGTNVGEENESSSSDQSQTYRQAENHNGQASKQPRLSSVPTTFQNECSVSSQQQVYARQQSIIAISNKSNDPESNKISQADSVSLANAVVVSKNQSLCMFTATGSASNVQMMKSSLATKLQQQQSVFQASASLSVTSTTQSLASSLHKPTTNMPTSLQSQPRLAPARSSESYSNNLEAKPTSYGASDASSFPSSRSNNTSSQLYHQHVANESSSSFSSNNHNMLSLHSQIASNTNDILDAGVDVVDDEELLASVTADLNHFEPLKDLNLMNVFDEMDGTNSSILSSLATSTSTSTLSSSSSSTSSSSNVAVSQSTQTLPFIIAQQHQQQPQAKSEAIVVNSATGAVLNQTQRFTQIVGSSLDTGMNVQGVTSAASPVYPPHASSFACKQSSSQSMVSPSSAASSPRHVFLPVRHTPAVRACAATQHNQLRPMQLGGDHSPHGKTGLRQQLAPASASVKPQAQAQQQQQQQQQQQHQQHQRQTVSPYQVTTQPNSMQQNPVALSSPLLVNLLQTDGSQGNALQQQQQQQQPQAVQQTQFISQTAAGASSSQIRLLAPPGSHGDGTKVIMVRVPPGSSQGTTKILNTASIVATVPTSQMVTSMASVSLDHGSNSSEVSSITLGKNMKDSMASSTPAKPKRVRKPRKPKNEVEETKPEPVVTSVSQMAPKPLTCPTVTSMALSRSLSTCSTAILTFPTQTKGESVPVSSMGQAQHMFNQQQHRVQPLVVLTTTSDGQVLTVSNPVDSAKNSTPGTTTACHVAVSGKRKQIFLATKSNSFPVSSALSSGTIMARMNTAAAASPVKLTSPISSQSVTSMPQSVSSLSVSSSSTSSRSSPSPGFTENVSGSSTPADNKSSLFNSPFLASSNNNDPVRLMNSMSPRLKDDKSSASSNNTTSNMNNEAAKVLQQISTSPQTRPASVQYSHMPSSLLHPQQSQQVVAVKLANDNREATMLGLLDANNANMKPSNCDSSLKTFLSSSSSSASSSTLTSTNVSLANLTFNMDSAASNYNKEDNSKSKDSAEQSVSAPLSPSYFLASPTIVEWSKPCTDKKEDNWNEKPPATDAKKENAASPPSSVKGSTTKPSTSACSTSTSQASSMGKSTSAGASATPSTASDDGDLYGYSKNNIYSQHLPDHILEDDEDDDDNDDDFNMFDKSSHFLSGSVGSFNRLNDNIVVPIANNRDTLPDSSSGASNSAKVDDVAPMNVSKLQKDEPKQTSTIREVLEENISSPSPPSLSQPIESENKSSSEEEKESVPETNLVQFACQPDMEEEVKAIVEESAKPNQEVAITPPTQPKDASEMKPVEEIKKETETPETLPVSSTSVTPSMSTLKSESQEDSGSNTKADPVKSVNSHTTQPKASLDSEKCESPSPTSSPKMVAIIKQQPKVVSSLGSNSISNNMLKSNAIRTSSEATTVGASPKYLLLPGMQNSGYNKILATNSASGLGQSLAASAVVNDANTTNLSPNKYLFANGQYFVVKSVMVNDTGNTSMAQTMPSSPLKLSKVVPTSAQSMLIPLTGSANQLIPMKQAINKLPTPLTDQQQPPPPANKRKIAKKVKSTDNSTMASLNIQSTLASISNDNNNSFVILNRPDVHNASSVVSLHNNVDQTVSSNDSQLSSGQEKQSVSQESCNTEHKVELAGDGDKKLGAAASQTVMIVSGNELLGGNASVVFRSEAQEQASNKAHKPIAAIKSSPGPATFAVKSSTAPSSPVSDSQQTKPIPAILRTSKRKNDTFVTIPSQVLLAAAAANSLMLTKVEPRLNSDEHHSSLAAPPLTLNQASVVSSLETFNVATMMPANKLLPMHNPIALSTLEETKQSPKPKRKRTRKAQLQTEDSATETESFSMIAHFEDANNQMVPVKRSATPTNSSRVLRNTGSAPVSGNTTTISPTLLRGTRGRPKVAAGLCKTEETSEPMASRSRKPNTPRVQRSRTPRRNKVKDSPTLELDPNLMGTDNAMDEPIEQFNEHGSSISPDIVLTSFHHEHLEQCSPPLELLSSSTIPPQESSSSSRTLEMLDCGNSNSSTASSSSSTSMVVKRSRKSAASASNKPSLRSTGVTTTVAELPAPKRRRKNPTIQNNNNP